jgi:predicted nucleic acid-binding Zn ribbon protein
MAVVPLAWSVVGDDGDPGQTAARSNAARRARRGEDFGPRPVVASLAEATRALGVDGAVELAGVQALWSEVAGEAVAAHAWPVLLRQGVLKVAVDHNAWAVELRLLSADLLQRLRGPCPAVRAIVVQVSPAGPQDPGKDRLSW